MIQRFVIRQPLERAYLRNAVFALELLDGVTLARVSNGITIVADGLREKPTVNVSGLFVWRREDISALRNISIDPGVLPYQRRELDRAALRLPPLPNPLTSIQLSPRIDYPLPSGMTGMRGTLIEDRSDPPVPVRDAETHLRWLDDDGVTWRDAPTRCLTNARGDFVSVLRLASSEVPQVDPSGALTVRLVVRRDEVNERSSTDVKLVQGRVADPTTLNAMRFAWDELQP
jgi:hypothetical protein